MKKITIVSMELVKNFSNYLMHCLSMCLSMSVNVCKCLSISVNIALVLKKNISQKETEFVLGNT